MARLSRPDHRSRTLRVGQGIGPLHGVTWGRIIHLARRTRLILPAVQTDKTVQTKPFAKKEHRSLRQSYSYLKGCESKLRRFYLHFTDFICNSLVRIYLHIFLWPQIRIASVSFTLSDFPDVIEKMRNAGCNSFKHNA